MKYLVKIFVITYFLLNCTYVYAEQNIVFIDMIKITNDSKAGTKAQKYMRDLAKKNVDDFKKIEENLKKEEQDLLSKKNILKKEEYKKKADELRNKINEYQGERRSKNEKLAQQGAELRIKLNEALGPILADYAKENQIEIILSKKEVILGAKEKDITDEIIKILDKKLPSISLQ